MCLEQCCPWLLGVGMMVAGQAGRTLRTLTASSLSVPDLQSAQPGTVISDSQHQDIHWGLNVHVCPQ